MPNELYANFLFDFFLLSLSFLLTIQSLPGGKGWKERILASPRHLGLTGMRLHSFLQATLALWLALVIIGTLADSLLPMLGIDDLAPVKEAAAGLAAQPSLLAYLLVVRVAAEEVFFRGFLVPRMGVLGSGVLFGLAHAFYGSLAEVLGAGLLGFILGYAFRKNGSLAPNLAAHALYNVSFIFFFA